MQNIVLGALGDPKSHQNLSLCPHGIYYCLCHHAGESRQRESPTKQELTKTDLETMMGQKIKREQLLSPVLSGLAHRTFSACPIQTPAIYHQIPVTHIFIFNRKNRHFLKLRKCSALICIISIFTTTL